MPADYDVESLAPGEAVAVEWPEKQYFEDRRTMSRSDILFCMDDPEGFREHRTGGPRETKKKSDALTLGTLTHIRLLEPDRWERDLAPPRKVPPHALADQATWTRHRRIAIEHNPQAIDATDAMVAKVNAIAKRVERHEFAASILNLEGPTEHTIVWREPETGVLCRVRLDKLGFSGDVVAVPDLKTGRYVRPDRFAKAMLDHRYHVQAALYSDAVAALYPGREVIYAIIAVRSSPPHKVGAWPVAERALSLGREVYRQGLRDYARRVSEDDWLEDWETDYTREIDLPEYVYRKKKS